MAGPTRGRTFSLPIGRRLVNELMRAGRGVPLVTIRREFSIPAVVEARSHRRPSVSWICLFAKAYALAARSIPNLRWNWSAFPWGRIYEHPESACAVVVEREWEGGPVVLGAKVRGPENLPLLDFDARIEEFRDHPVEEVRHFRALLRLARLPWPLRPFVTWLVFRRSGEKRAKAIGTFAISSVGQFGVETVTPVVPVSAYLTFGPISPEGRVTVGLIFDHRVMDGRHGARALADMEHLMNTAIAAELRAVARGHRPAAAPEARRPTQLV
jgi:hypothetical protein